MNHCLGDFGEYEDDGMGFSRRAKKRVDSTKKKRDSKLLGTKRKIPINERKRRAGMLAKMELEKREGRNYAMGDFGGDDGMGFKIKIKKRKIKIKPPNIKKIVKAVVKNPLKAIVPVAAVATGVVPLLAVAKAVAPKNNLSKLVPKITVGAKQMSSVTGLLKMAAPAIAMVPIVGAGAAAGLTVADGLAKKNLQKDMEKKAKKQYAKDEAAFLAQEKAQMEQDAVSTSQAVSSNPSSAPSSKKPLLLGLAGAAVIGGIAWLTLKD